MIKKNRAPKNSNKKTVFITGVSGYFGTKLVDYFSRQDDVGSIIGIDIADPPRPDGKLKFIRHDVREDMIHLMAGHDIDWAIHAAYILAPIHDTRLMEDINLNGTRCFLRSCVQGGVRHIMEVSSTTAYGFYADNPPLLTEESPLRGNDNFTYARNKKEIENELKVFSAEHPEMPLTVVRPCFVVGPGFNNPLARHLRKPLVMLPGDAKPFQFVHEDDLVEAMYLLLRKRRTGAYNITADGTMTFDEMISCLGGIHLPIPPFIIYPLNNLAWFLRLGFITEFPSSGMDLMRHPWIADNSKIKRELGYRFKYTTAEAFDDFVRYVKMN